MRHLKHKVNKKSILLYIMCLLCVYSNAVLLFIHYGFIIMPPQQICSQTLLPTQ